MVVVFLEYYVCGVEFFEMNVFVLLEFVFELKKFLRGFDESYGGKILVVCSFYQENNYEVLFEDKGLFDG